MFPQPTTIINGKKNEEIKRNLSLRNANTRTYYRTVNLSLHSMQVRLSTDKAALANHRNLIDRRIIRVDKI